MKNEKNQFSAVSVLCAGSLWGCMGILVKTMNRAGFGSLEIAAFRSVVTSILLFVFLLIKGRKTLYVRPKDLWCFFGTGFFSVVFFNVCYFSCMNYTSLSTAAILLYTAPSFVMVMSFFLFKESFTVKKLVALGLAFLGCILVSGGFGLQTFSARGILTGLGAGFGYALYSIFGRYALQRGYNSYTITFYTFLFASLGSLPIIKLPQMVQKFGNLGGELWFAVLMAIITTVLPYLFYTRGLKGLDNGKASILASVEPVVASAVGFLVYHETMNATGVLGMLLVLGSCVIVGLEQRQSKTD